MIIASTNEVSNNNINLKDGAGADPNDQYIALRVRKNSSSKANIIMGNNRFEQEELVEVIENTQDATRRLLRQQGQETKASTHPDKAPDLVMKSEWEYGGCPFARA